MKKVLALILVLTFLFAACAKNEEPSVIEEEVASKQEEVVETKSEFYKTM